jgi:hypothetical protein
MKTYFWVACSVLVSVALIAIFVTPSIHGQGGVGVMNAAGGSLPWASASALTAATNTSLLVEKGPRWSVIGNPGTAGTLATATKAAGGAGVRHVADCVTFSAGSTTAPALSFMFVHLRDGASGAGTILNAWIAVTPATTGEDVPPHSICGLGFVGSANTAMTIEFSTAVANLVQAVSLTGYDVN